MSMSELRIKKSKCFLFSMTEAIVRAGMTIEKHENSEMARLGKGISHFCVFCNYHLQLEKIQFLRSRAD